MARQIVIIGGGDTFETYEEYLNFLRTFQLDVERYKTDKDDWKPWIRKQLENHYEVITPVMPNKFNAQFEEWKIWFEKFIPFINGEVILIGHSLGGSFLAKYLAENNFPRKVRSLHLVAAAFSDNLPEYKMLGFAPPESLENVISQVEKIFLYHSKDDFVVPFSDLAEYREKLPNSEVRIFENRGHLNMEEFPELLEDIKGLNL